MSTVKVEVVPIADVRPHSNADSLELATVGGWQMCVKKGQYKNGDPVVYVEPGTSIARAVAERLNVVTYLSEKVNIDGDRVLVVKSVKLRGEPSFGLIITPEPGMKIGDDVAAHYGAQKFMPPVRVQAGDSAPADSRFPSYTEIENMRSYPLVFNDGEEVVVTEKIHGTNCRVGFVVDAKVLPRQMTLMAGSKGLRRKQPPDEAAMRTNTYWFPFTLPTVNALLRELFDGGANQAILYGEVFGLGIQAYTYGKKTVTFRAFDLMLNGKYLNYDEFKALCDKHAIETVPVVWRGPFSLAQIKKLSEGPSLVGGPHGREGVVVKPTTERIDPTIGRVVLKYIGDAYLFGKAAEQDTTDM